MDRIFADRTEAGQLLAAELAEYTDHEDVVVLALPRGGVPVAYQVAEALHAPMDVFLVRKLGVPGQSELAMGAIASGGVIVLNHEVLGLIRISDEEIKQVVEEENEVLRERQAKYLGDRKPISVKDKVVILVDDGIATGSTIQAAIKAIKELDAKKIIVAVPTAPAETIEILRPEVDEIICLMTPYPFTAISLWYRDFAQTSDEEVIEMLDRSAKNQGIKK